MRILRRSSTCKLKRTRSSKRARFELLVSVLEEKESKQLQLFVEENMKMRVQTNNRSNELSFDYYSCSEEELDSLIAFLLNFKKARDLNKELEGNETKVRMRLTDQN